MCLCHLCAERFLSGAAGSVVLQEFCSTRGLPAPPEPLSPGPERRDAARRWSEAVATLPAEVREPAAREAQAAADLAGPRGNAHLLEAARIGLDAGAGPPPDVPDGLPLALWFQSYRPELFARVRRRHTHRDDDVWAAARSAPVAKVLTPGTAAVALAGMLAAFFGGAAPADWHVASYHLPQAAAFVAEDERSRAAGRSSRPDGSALRGGPLQFVAYPENGTLLLHPAPGPADLRRGLLEAFAAALEVPLSPEPAFDLGRLLEPLPATRDAPDLLGAAVTQMQLSAPARDGRGLLTLDAADAGDPDALKRRLRAHRAGGVIDEFTVAAGVVRLDLDGPGGPRRHLVRLWPDRCDLGPGPLGDRALRCLRRWGL